MVQVAQALAVQVEDVLVLALVMLTKEALPQQPLERQAEAAMRIGSLHSDRCYQKSHLHRPWAKRGVEKRLPHCCVSLGP
jgi:hypothetical protein